MIRIVADDKIPFLKGALEQFAEVIYLPGHKIGNEDLKNADALLTRTRTTCNESLLKGTTIRFIGTATIGFDHIDTAYCEKNKIYWTNAPGCNSSSVLQYIAAALFKVAHLQSFNLKFKTIGIVGVGNVGSKVEKLARRIGMRVLLNDPPRARNEAGGNFVDLDKILNESDFITVHVPLNISGEDQTFHFFDSKVFKKMKTGIWLFNSSRGEVIDTNDLKGALTSGKLGGAVLDVWENEPHIDLDLLSKAFIVSPHIAGYSADGKANGTSMIVNSLCKFFELPQYNWYPDNIPPPPSADILIECNGKTEEDILREAVFHTYDICRDDRNLRSSPLDFERLRGDYPLRREFPSYRVNLKSATKNVQNIIKDLGFKV
jgi:erythronate-4-phosphate dehydrogenase